MRLFLKNRIVILDDDDWVKMRRYKFTVIKSGNTHYCRRTTGVNEMMHRMIMGLPPRDPKLVDHINGNGLDNRKSNLRLTDHTRNAHNIHVIQGRIPFQGVFVDGKKYRSMIRVGGKRIHLGNFDTPLQAALAYDCAAIKYHGEHATNLNRDLLLKIREDSSETEKT